MIRVPGKTFWVGVAVVFSLGVVTLAGRLAIIRLDFFKIHLVEVDGLEFLDPHKIVAALGIPEDANILVSLKPILANAEGLPGVRSAELSRRWPGTLRLEVVESPAVALVQDDSTLVVADDRGDILPYLPSRLDRALPLASKDSATAALLGRLRRADPQWYRVFDFAERTGGSVKLWSGGRAILVRPDANDDLLRTIAAVRQWLDDAGRGWRDLDARFKGRIFVRKDEA